MRLLLYTQAMVTQISQTAACNRLHSVERRLARLLLLVHDRLQFADLPLTQEGLSHMLGVRRESVNVAARRLQGAGIIRYNRGSIRILNRAGLEAVTCECCRVVRLEFDRLLGSAAKE
jgi:CRP-like cAMP-binding protein